MRSDYVCFFEVFGHHRGTHHIPSYSSHVAGGADLLDINVIEFLDVLFGFNAIGEIFEEVMNHIRKDISIFFLFFEGEIRIFMILQP